MRPTVCLLAALSGAPLFDVPAAPDRSFASTVEPIVANQNRRPAGRLRNGTLTVALELRTGRFRPYADEGDGVVVQAFGEAGRPLEIPGPLIRVPEGTVIQASIRNTLRDSTLVLHGLETRPGNPGDTIQVPPRKTRTVRFAAGAPGTYFYWGTTTGAQMEDDRSIDSQLHGALIVDPAGTRPDPEERVFAIGLWLEPADTARGKPEREIMVINGKAWPHTERFTYTVGDTARWRWVNPTSSSHPMHLHGFYYRVDSRGTWAADTAYAAADRRMVVTELLRPGGTMTAQWSPSQPGNWIFHCHFAFHVSSELYLAGSGAPKAAHAGHGQHGMSGLVLGLQVKPRSTPYTAAAVADRRALHLVAQRAPAGGDSAHMVAYSLQDPASVSTRDSMTIPGPTIVLERGKPVRITVENRLPGPTAVHWHGIELESYPDGVPNWSGDGTRVFRPIEPGDSFAAEFTPPRAGTFMYHAHFDEVRQILGGLYGPLIVIEPGTTLDTATNRLVLIGGLLRNDTAFGVINGRTDPAPIELRALRTYRFRLFNIGDARTSFLLRRPDSSAVAWRAVAKDGADLPASQTVDLTEPLMTGPGEIADFEFTPDAPGELILDVHSPFAPWRIGVPVTVLPQGATAAR